MNSLIILNGYGFDIIDNRSKKIVYRKGYYYLLENTSTYKIRLMNNRGVRTDAYCWIGDQKIGIWRVNPYSSIIIEKPVDSEETFRFNKDSNNLIRVEFCPEQITDDYSPPIRTYPCDDEPICEKYLDTITPYNKNHRVCALSDNSYEKYILNNLSIGYNVSLPKPKKVDKLETIDKANVTIIYAKLIEKDDNLHQYKNIKNTKMYNDYETMIPK